MENEGIPKLEKREGVKLYDEPLLEYVCDASDLLFLVCDGPFEGDIGPSWVYSQFAEYYFKGEIDTSMETKYLNNEVQNILKAFGLDRDKFWYLCLMIKDVVRGYTEDAHPHAPTPREELKDLFHELLKMEPEIYDEELACMKGQWKSCKNAAELTLQVKKEGNSKNGKFTIISKKTLWYLAVAVYQFLEKNPMPKAPNISDLDSVSGIDEIFRYEKTTEKEIWRVALFHKYLNWFLTRHLKDKTIKKKIMTDEIWSDDGTKQKLPNPIPWTPDTNKQRLISRMIFILGISTKKKYNDPKSKILHDNLKGDYADPKPRNHNSRYFIDIEDC